MQPGSGGNGNAYSRHSPNQRRGHFRHLPHPCVRASAGAAAFEGLEVARHRRLTVVVDVGGRRAAIDLDRAGAAGLGPVEFT